MQVDGKPYADSVTVTIPKNGTIKTESFKEITFTMAGTYVFEITEKVPPEVTELPGITEYSDAVWTLTIVIRDTDHQLEVESYQYKDDSKTDDGIFHVLAHGVLFNGYNGLGVLFDGASAFLQFACNLRLFGQVGQVGMDGQFLVFRIL